MSALLSAYIVFYSHAHGEITHCLPEEFKNRSVCNCPLLPLIGLYKKAYFPAFLSVGLSPSLFLCVR